jgi:hypothetical protein
LLMRLTNPDLEPILLPVILRKVGKS